RLKVAGNSEEIFTPEAKELIYEQTKGFPRKIVVLCHNLIIDMLTLNKNRVDSSIVFKRMGAKDLLNV
ncbi:general secretion pathway protein GspA, partial [bacterium]|nr:general secretion pathway protein GspA [bacterium]